MLAISTGALYGWSGRVQEGRDGVYLSGLRTVVTVSGRAGCIDHHCRCVSGCIEGGTLRRPSSLTRIPSACTVLRVTDRQRPRGPSGHSDEAA